MTIRKVEFGSASLWFRNSESSVPGGQYFTTMNGHPLAVAPVSETLTMLGSPDGNDTIQRTLRTTVNHAELARPISVGSVKPTPVLDREH